MANNVSLSYDQIESIAGQLRTGEEQITSDFARLRSLVEQLVSSGFVTQYASPQFNETYQDYTANATKVTQELNTIAQYLDTAVRIFQEADEQLKRAAQQ